MRRTWGSFEPSSQEDTQFEIFLFRTHEEIACLPREHDRVVRCGDALLTECSRCFAQPFPRLAEVIGKMTRQSGLRCAPAIVRLSVRDPLLAVETFNDRPLQYILPPEARLGAENNGGQPWRSKMDGSPTIHSQRARYAGRRTHAR